MVAAGEMADILQLMRKPNLDTWANDVRLMVENWSIHKCPGDISFRAANAHEF